MDLRCSRSLADRSSGSVVARSGRRHLAPNRRQYGRRVTTEWKSENHTLAAGSFGRAVLCLPIVLWLVARDSNPETAGLMCTARCGGTGEPWFAGD